MTATPSIGHPATERNGHKIAERIRRGIKLYSERGQEIEWAGPDRLYVPSCSSGRRYLVVLTDEGARCACKDYEIHGEELGICKHGTCAMIADAKRVEYRVERRFDSRFDMDIYYLVEVRGGSERDVSRRVAQSDIYLDKWKLEGYRVEVA